MKKIQDRVKRAGEVLNTIYKIIREQNVVAFGHTGIDVDEFIQELLIKFQARSACWQYNGFPKHCCISVNNAVCHGIPNCRAFGAGDIVKVDVSLEKDGVFVDGCSSYIIEPCKDQWKYTLLEDSRRATLAGIEAVKINYDLSCVGESIEEYIKNTEWGIIEEFCGHETGTALHGNYQILNKLSSVAATRRLFKQNDVFTVEPPIVSAKFYELEINGWDIHVVQPLGSIVSQFEYTIVLDGAKHYIFGDILN